MKGLNQGNLFRKIINDLLYGFPSLLSVCRRAKTVFLRRLIALPSFEVIYSTHKCFLFGVFADIQEFYELTLLDDSKSVQEKTAETIRIANKWETNDGPIAPPYNNEVSF